MLTKNERRLLKNQLNQENFKRWHNDFYKNAPDATIAFRGAEIGLFDYDEEGFYKVGNLTGKGKLLDMLHFIRSQVKDFETIRFDIRLCLFKTIKNILFIMRHLGYTIVDFKPTIIDNKAYWQIKAKQK